MVQQRTERANGYQMTPCSSLRHADMPHMASFTSLPTNSSHSPHRESLPALMVWSYTHTTVAHTTRVCLSAWIMQKGECWKARGHVTWCVDCENKFTGTTPHPHPARPSNWDSSRWSRGMQVREKHKPGKKAFTVKAKAFSKKAP